MDSKSGNAPRIIFITIGILLILVPAVIFSVIFYKDLKLKKENDAVMPGLLDLIPSRTEGFKEQRANPEMPLVQYNGIDFCGIVDIVFSQDTIPVRSKWDSKLSSFAAGRYFGNPYEGSLVVGIPKAKDGMDFQNRIDVEDEVDFTDMRGRVFRYRVTSVRHFSELDFSRVNSDDYDLLLFCTGRESGYIMISCVIY